MERIKLVLDLMRADCVSLLGSGKRLAVIIAASTVLSVLAGSFIIPVYPFVLLEIAILITSDIVNHEGQTGSGKLTSVLPTDRQSVVYARFALSTLTVAGFGAVLFVLMQISMKLRLFAMVADLDFDELFELMNVSASADSFFNVLFGVGFLASLVIMSFMLKKYFKHGSANKKNTLIKTVLLGIALYFIFGLVFGTIITLTTIPFLQTAFSLIFGIITSLMKPMNGMVAVALLAAAGLGHTAYMAVSSMIEYEKREL